MSVVLPADDPTGRERALSELRQAGIVVVPTPSTYVVVADAFSPIATRRIIGVKRRARTVPLSVLIRSTRQTVGLVEDIPEAAERLMASYWPGSLTLVFRAVSDLPWDLGETGGTVGVQLPASDLLLDLIGEVGPLATSGANRTGEPLPATVEEAQHQLGSGVPLYLDGGECRAGVSTVVDVSAPAPQVLREGAVPATHVQQVATGEVGWGARPEAETADGPAGEEPGESGDGRSADRAAD